MSQPERPADVVTILTTANVKGELHLLPRLFSTIQTQRKRASGPVFLLDLGDSCAVEAWPCRATLGQAPFVVFDAMGYDAALVGGPEAAPILPDSLRRVRTRLVMQTLIWGRAAVVQKKRLALHLLTPGAPPAAEDGWRVAVERERTVLPQPGEPPVLVDVPGAHVARLDIHAGEWTVLAAEFVPVPPTADSDPSIAAIVELVESEARRYAQQQERDS